MSLISKAIKLTLVFSNDGNSSKIFVHIFSDVMAISKQKPNNVTSFLHCFIRNNRRCNNWNSVRMCVFRIEPIPKVNRSFEIKILSKFTPSANLQVLSEIQQHFFVNALFRESDPTLPF